jgi:hypothetical protein
VHDARDGGRRFGFPHVSKADVDINIGMAISRFTSLEFLQGTFEHYTISASSA